MMETVRVYDENGAKWFFEISVFSNDGFYDVKLRSYDNPDCCYSAGTFKDRKGVNETITCAMEQLGFSFVQPF